VPDSLVETLADAASAVWCGLILPESLPSIATQLLVEGADGVALRELAGLDLAPFDPRDAYDLLGEILEQAHVSVDGLLDRARRALALVAAALVRGNLESRGALRLIDLIVVATGYADTPAMALYGLSDEWDGGWGRTRDEINQDLEAAARSIADAAPTPAEILLAHVIR
jgi:hypothetical protein